MLARVLVEGNIGCGKSTLLRHLAENLDYRVFLEPLEKWQNFKGYNALAECNRKPFENSLAFQMLVGHTLFEREQLATNGKVVVLERSLFSSRNVFARYALERNYINSFQHACLINFLDDRIHRSSFKPNLISYLHASPGVLHDRIKFRGRVEEKNILIEELEHLNVLHDSYLKSSDIPTIIIEQNSSEWENKFICAHEINEFVNRNN